MISQILICFQEEKKVYLIYLIGRQRCKIQQQKNQNPTKKTGDIVKGGQ